MKRGWLWWTIVANLAALIALVFIYPHLMVSPGPLMPAHAELATDCFACHAPWRGIAEQRCVSCHAVADIGIRNSKGSLLPQRSNKSAFHQHLASQDCMACHSDHAGPKLTQRNRKQFSHNLLRTEAAQTCRTCHAAPNNQTHQSLTVGCAQCHRTDAWRPAHFDHASLAKDVLARCVSCHKAPVDKLHAQIQGNCGQCHAPTGWKPATFEHAKFFALDRNHNVSCVTCHTDNNYRRYTCYGCHEHTPAKIRSKHVREGIPDFENCVKCHRSADGESEGEGSREGGGEREGRRHD